MYSHSALNSTTVVIIVMLPVNYTMKHYPFPGGARDLIYFLDNPEAYQIIK